MDPHEHFSYPDIPSLSELLPAYRIEAFIAAGGMGAVYRARQVSLDRTVALKILPRELVAESGFRESFLTEARAMARLNHPSLISVYDCGEVDGMPYIAMEYVHGQSLFDCANGRSIDPEQAVDIILRISAGLAHAHAAGIIHRDIKPANILLNVDAEPKIGDFGLACRVEAAPELCMGTPGYVAPEVMERPDTADKRSDIFGVGVILHELLTGMLPETSGRLPPSANAKVDARMDRICLRATHPDPNLRYPAIEAFIRDLEEWKNHHGRRLAVPAATPGGHAATVSKQIPSPLPARRSAPNLALRIAIIVILLVAIGIVWMVRENRKQEIDRMLASKMAEQEPTAPPHAGEVSREEPVTPAEPPAARDEPTPPANTATVDPHTEPPFPMGVWRHLNYRRTLMTFLPDHTCINLQGNKARWTWEPAGNTGIWTVRWENGYTDTLEVAMNATTAEGTNQNGSAVRFEKLPWVAAIPEGTFLGRWTDRRDRTLEWRIEPDGLAYGVRTRGDTPPATTSCTWRRGPNGDQITVLWDGNEKWFNVMTFRSDNRRYAQLFNQVGYQTMLVPSEMLRPPANEDKPDIAGLFPEGSEWHGSWRLGDGEALPVTCKVESASAHEARLVMTSRNGSWTCIVGSAGGAARVRDILTNGTSRYTHMDSDPAAVDQRTGAITLSCLGTRSQGNETIPETIECELNLLAGSDAAAAPGIELTEAEWKAKAAADFPALADPKSLLSRTVKDLNGRKDASYRAEPDWPYRLAREAALSLLPNRAGKNVPDDARVFRGGFFAVCKETVDWKRAREQCKRWGGRLAIIPDEETNAILARVTGPAEVWIGASDERNEGTWEWVDGSPVNYSAFLEGEPNNAKRQEHYLSLKKSGRWNDMPLHHDHVSGFICEWPASEKPGGSPGPETPSLPAADAPRSAWDRMLVLHNKMNEFIDPKAPCFRGERIVVDDQDRPFPVYKKVWGKSDVFIVHPLNREKPAEVEFRKITMEGAGTLVLRLRDHPSGDCEFRILRDGATVKSGTLDENSWKTFRVRFNRQPVTLEISANGWSFEHAFVTYTVDLY